jgi:polyhydroxyalkanoate synthase
MNGAVDFIRKSHGIEKINKMGICQGGTFSTIYAAFILRKLIHLTVYVAPFDFTTDKCMLYKWTKYIDVDTMVDHFRSDSC